MKNFNLLYSFKPLIFFLFLQILIKQFFCSNYFCFIYIGALFSKEQYKNISFMSLFFSFFLGLCVDMIYGTLGVHSFACVFTTFIKQKILKFLGFYIARNSNHVSVRTEEKFLSLKELFLINSFLTFIHIFVFKVFSTEEYFPKKIFCSLDLLTWLLTSLITCGFSFYIFTKCKKNFI